MKILVAFLMSLVLSLSLSAQKCPPSKSKDFYVVQKGDTHYSIARWHGITVEQLTKWNKTTIEQPLKICALLYVVTPEKAMGLKKDTLPANIEKAVISEPAKPVAAPSEKVIPVEMGIALPAQPITPANLKPYSAYRKQVGCVHVVGEGEKVADISRLYGYTEEFFREFNGLPTTGEIDAGTAIRNSNCHCYNGGPDTSKTVGLREVEREKGVIETLIEKDKVVAPVAAKVETVTPSNKLTLDEVAMLDEVNKLRQNPPDYVKKVEAYIEKIKSGEVVGNIAAAKDLISSLKKLPPLPLLSPQECLYMASKQLGSHIKESGKLSHTGANNSQPHERMMSLCPTNSAGAENVVGGNDPMEEQLMRLLIDASYKTRDHRKNLLNPEWRYFSCHKVEKVGLYDSVWVQNFGK